MKINIRFILVLLAAGLSLTRCDKGYEPLDMTMTVYTVMQRVQNRDTLVEGWVGYYLYADTTDYIVTSFEAAEKGLFSAVASIKKAKSGEGEGDDGDDDTEYKEGIEALTRDSVFVRFENLIETPVLLLIVHPDDSIYAWRQLDFVDGLDSMSTKLTFKAYEAGRKETVNKWSIVSKPKPKEPEKPEEPEPEDPGDGDDKDPDEIDPETK